MIDDSRLPWPNLPIIDLFSLALPSLVGWRQSVGDNARQHVINNLLAIASKGQFASDKVLATS